MKLLSKFIVTALGLSSIASAAPTSSSSAENAQKTVPTELTLGVKQVPNILNDTAVDANVAAKGYSW